MNLHPLQEISILFNFSKEIAHINGKDELLRVINQQLKDLFYFTHSLIGQIDDNQTEAIPIDKGIIGQVIQSNKPLIFDLEEGLKEPELPGFLKMNFEKGIR